MSSMSSDTLDDGNVSPDTNTPDMRPLQYNRIIFMTSEGYYRSLLTHMTTRWLDLFTCDRQLYEYDINN